MSQIQANYVEDTVIDRAKAFSLADRRAREAGAAIRRANFAGRWVFGFAFPLTVAIFCAILGVLVGSDLAETAIGRVILVTVQPLIDAFAHASAVEYLIGCGFLAIVALVCYVRS